jgi:twitching motility two-component system response regulator PilG
MRTEDSDLSAGEQALQRGVLAARAGLLSVASASLERAAENLPDDPDVWLWLAWVANSPDNTIRCLQRVLELSPGHAAASAGLTWVRALAHESAAPSTSSAPPPVAETPTVMPEPEAVVVAEAPAITAEAAPMAVPVVAAAEPSGEEPAVAVAAPAETVDDWNAPPESLTQVRRRWNDLVQRASETYSESMHATPAVLIPPPLPTAPPPLPTITTEPELSVPARFSDAAFGTEAESGAEVDVLTRSFQPTSEATASDGRPLVMVVDDSPTVRKLVALTLERRGYRVISAFDGVAAIKELGSCRPDLILLDINMPRLDGYRLCKLIKKHEATQAIPVVMLSGKDGMFDKLRGRLVGCSDYITKPFEADALTHKVAKYLAPASSS